MDSPSSNNNTSNQPMEESKTQTQTQSRSQNRSPSNDPIQSEEHAIIPIQGAEAGAEPQPLDQDEDLQLGINGEDREYGCKFCDKKFSNKQALGGHQNAHKIERSVEKTTRDMHETAVSYFAAQSSNTPVLTAFNQRTDLLNRAYIPWPFPAQQQQPYFNARPVMHIPEPNYGPRPAFNNAYQGWAQPAPRLPYIPPNPNYFNQGGYLGFQAAAQRPVYELQAAAGGLPGPLRLGPERNPEINFAHLRGEDFDEAGLDLTLRL